eukprot:Hpha_TRINITY_DN11294_c0_g2::TRINITY_DN11294_c0_g2_i1::g.167464::m.167464
MGQIFSAVAENFEVTDLGEAEYQPPPQPGPVRVAFRKLRRTLVRGEGKRILPEWNEETDCVDVEANQPDEVFEPTVQWFPFRSQPGAGTVPPGRTELVPVLLRTKGIVSMTVAIDPLFCTIDNFKALVANKMEQKGFKPIDPESQRLEVEQGRWKKHKDGGRRWEPGRYVHPPPPGGDWDKQWQPRGDGADLGAFGGRTDEDIGGYKLVTDLTNEVAPQQGEAPQPELPGPSLRPGLGIPIRVVNKEAVDAESESESESDESSTRAVLLEKKKQKRRIAVRFKKNAESGNQYDQASPLIKRRRSSVAASKVVKGKKDGRRSSVAPVNLSAEYKKVAADKRRASRLQYSVDRRQSAARTTGDGGDGVEEDEDEVLKKLIQERAEYRGRMREHQEKVAKGCRRSVDEWTLVAMAGVSFILMIWCWTTWSQIKSSTSTEYYDRAHKVTYTLGCNVERMDIVGWWFRTGLLHTVALLLLLVNEFFYWCAAPAIFGGALTTCDRGLTRTFISLAWVAWVMVELVMGSMIVWSADAELCHAAVEEAKGVLMIQYLFIPVQIIIHTSDWETRQALFSTWCLQDRSELTKRSGPVLHNWNKDYYGWRILARKYRDQHRTEVAASENQPFGHGDGGVPPGLQSSGLVEDQEPIADHPEAREPFGYDHGFKSPGGSNHPLMTGSEGGNSPYKVGSPHSLKSPGGSGAPLMKSPTSSVPFGAGQDV